MSKPKALTPKKAALLAHVLAGESVRNACELAGIPERSGYRWISEPVFKRELSERRSVLVDSVSGDLLVMAEKAVRALESVLDKPEQRGANIKRLAAVSVLELVLRFREQNDIEQRLANLESGAFQVKQF